MEMNFDHKGLEQTALKRKDDAPAPFADHHALLARVIARQASSQSARTFVAAKQGLPGDFAGKRASFLNDRMAFFAGRTRSDTSGDKTAMLFRTGCFRPDLTKRKTNEMQR